MSDQLARARRAAEIALFAPFGLVAYLRDAAPTLMTVLVARGRGEVDRTCADIGHRVRHVRNYGDAAIAFGLRQPREDRDDTEGTRPGAEGDATIAETESGATGESRLKAVSDETHSSAGDPPPSRPGRVTTTSDDLAIPGYDSLSASQVVERLAGLDEGQLDAVRTYESETRRRRTILGKIEQLTA